MLLTFENATANNALLEALACGLPIVSEKIGGIPEYINDECSILCERENVNQIVDALLSLENDFRKRESMATAARNKALQLDWKTIAGKIEDYYNKITCDL
jgi:glycosyltransferase involved in cell wall biosynthesis